MRDLRWKGWAAALGTAAFVRAVVALVMLGGMPMVSDARDYFDAAVRFASGDHSGPFYYPPGESLAVACGLATAGQNIVVARLVTVAMSTITVGLTALLARELAGEKAALAAAFMAALYAPSVLLSGQTYSQHLAALCLAAFAYFGMRALRERRATLFVTAGAALGLGCLTRPSMATSALILLAAWVHALVRDRASVRRLAVGAVLVSCTTLAFVIPAQSHNARAGAGWSISTNNERNLFLGNNPYTPDYKTSHLGQRSLDELAPDARAYLVSFYAVPDSRSAMERAALAYMAKHPVRSAWRTLLRATSFWGFDYVASREIQKWFGWGTRAMLPLLALEAGSFFAVGILALAGLTGLRRSCDAGWGLWLVALALAYEAPYTIAFSGGTYHFPVMPLITPFAAVAVAHGMESWRIAKERRTTIVAFAVFVLVQMQGAYAAVAFGT